MIEEKIAKTEVLKGSKPLKRRKKPDFIRQEYGKKKRIKKKWRKPRGIDSKLRLKLYGKKLVSPGYGSPKDIKSLHAFGLKEVLVYNVKDLEKIDPLICGVVIAGSVGQKKTIAIIKAAKEKKITLLNIKDPDAYLKKVEHRKEKRKKVKKEVKKEKEKESIEDMLSEEEKKKKEKKEIDRLLTKKF